MIAKVFLCPSDKKHACSWEGSSDDILQHFSDEHEDLLAFTNSVTIDLREISENKLILHDEEIYLLQHKIIDNNFYIFLRYLGPSKIASYITFDIDIESSDIKLDKRFVTVRCGYFGISLDKIRETFKKENVLECTISVSGDFKSISGSDENTSNVENNVENNDNPEEEVIEETVNLVKNDKSLNEKIANGTDTESGKEGMKNNSHDLIDDVFSTLSDSGISTDDKSPRKSLVRTTSLTSFTDGSSDFFDNLATKVNDSDATVTRSKSLNDEARRKFVVRKNPSVHSLESIKEDDLDMELHCVNCENLLYSPIFSCLSGHNVCSYCAVCCEKCKSCSENVTGERNTILEEKASQHLYSCKYKKHGCSVKLPYKDILKHHIGCTFCLYYCPITGCGHSGGFRNMYHHLKLIHSSTKIFESFIATFQKYSDAFLVHEEKGIFYCCVLNLPESVVWEAKFCGPNERKFFCELKFKERNLKEPLLLRQATNSDCYKIELNSQELKKLKVKSKNAIITITR